MEWIQRNPKKAAGLAGLVVLVLVIVVWGMSRGGSNASASGSALGLATPTSTPLFLPPDPTLLPGTSATSSPSGGATGKAFESPLGKAGQAKGAFGFNGFPGGSLDEHAPRHQLDIDITSEAPVGTVGYVIPTSLRKYYGIDKKVGTSWHLSTTVYGGPDYARVFFQAGSRGFPITCTIRVDGRVTAHRSTEGPYGKMMCQG